jgi:SAM-dependent methyltransferase
VSATVQGELWSSDPRGWAEAAEGRIRPLYERVLERLHLLPGTRLLDAGCGSGLFAELAAQGGADVIGLDAARGLVEYARRRRPAAGYVVEDLERMPFGDGAFDVATAFNSVLYAADPRRALAEIARVTAPSGRAVVTVGAGPEQAESAALIDPLAPTTMCPTAARSTSPTRIRLAARCSMPGSHPWRWPTSRSTSTSRARTTRSPPSCRPARSPRGSGTPAAWRSKRRCGSSSRRDHGPTGPCAWASSSAAISRSGRDGLTE